MLVLHISEHDNGLFFWGESSAGSVRKTPAASPPRHPFGATKKELMGALQEMTSSKMPGRTSSAAIWLPAKDDGPLPSSSIIAEPSASKTKTRNMPWSVVAYRPADIGETVSILLASADKRILAPGAVAGTSVQYWVDVLHFAGSMVARQQFLPGITSNHAGKHHAVWGPIFVGEDAEQLASLVQRMPASARAMADPGDQSPPSQAPDAVLRRVVSGLVDHLVRKSADKTLPMVGAKKFDSAHDAWIYALRSKNGTITANPADVAELASQIYEWQRPVAAISNFPFRLCFFLEEPIVDAGSKPVTWYVRYLLQSHDDPSLLVPVRKAWAGEIPLQKEAGSGVREFLLLSLGHASRVCSGIADGLKNYEMDGHAVDSAGAHKFLTQEAVALKQAGYGIMLPAWWTTKGTKARLALRPRVKNKKKIDRNVSVLPLSTIMQFDWQVALGDYDFTMEELEELARLKQPLIKIRGQWVEVNPDEIREAITLMKQKASDATLQDIIRMSIGTSKAPGGMDLGGVRADDWIADVLERLSSKAGFSSLEQPDGFAGTLRPYQLRGFSWLVFLSQMGLGGCLADDMGLGKTIQTLAHIQRDRQADGRGQQPTLLICPTSVVNNWQKEAERFTPELPVLVHHGADRLRDKSFQKAAKESAVVVSSYGLLLRDVKIFGGMQWRGVILDEAQNIKNAETKQAMAARSLKADYRFALTGTPVENNVGDLWSIMEFLNPGLLGTRTEFDRRFSYPIQTGDLDAATRLRRATDPFILRRLKTDKSIISDLPDKMEMNVFCTLTKEQASLYASVLKDAEEMLAVAEGMQRRGVILATISKLKQVCNHPAQFLGDNSSTADRSGKLARLTEMLEEVAESGDKALIFSQFAEMGQILRRHIQETLGLEVLFLHGGTTKGNRDRMVECFQSKTGPKIFVLSLKAGGTGLNLTAASHVFHFDRWWNPAVENQATDRAFRIGQKKNVQVHKFICSGTLEEAIDTIISSKKEVAESVVGTGEGWLTEFSNEELRNVLALNQATVM